MPFLDLDQGLREIFEDASSRPVTSARSPAIAVDPSLEYAHGARAVFRRASWRAVERRLLAAMARDV